MPDKLENSILARTRAKYGKMLTESDFVCMASLSSVSDIAAYLRGRTKFAKPLKDINTASVHRYRLEKLLRQAQLDDVTDIIKGCRSGSKALIDYITGRENNAIILNVIKNLSAGTGGKIILEADSVSGMEGIVEIRKAATAKNTEELAKLFGNTVYSKVLSSYPSDCSLIDTSLLEASLEKIVIEKVLLDADESESGSNLEKFRELFLLNAELGDCAVIYRNKKFYRNYGQSVRPYLLGFRLMLNEASFEKIIAADSADEMISVMKSTKYKRFFDKYGSFDNPDKFTEQAVSSLAAKNIHFSTSPQVVAASYYFTLNTELLNIIRIIEGVRYGRDPETIKSNLIFINREVN